jgi:hypothetical protein
MQARHGRDTTTTTTTTTTTHVKRHKTRQDLYFGFLAPRDDVRNLPLLPDVHSTEKKKKKKHGWEKLEMEDPNPNREGTKKKYDYDMADLTFFYLFRSASLCQC